eukprot:GDKH01006352.1.p1 GENE.GDKH01006352.1~~GDKH01006352.1.p1  ORF type:complete len:278 (+),score=57.62 GDKH01006352.1:143-976(+)
MADAPDLDAAFASFMGEVATMPTVRPVQRVNRSEVKRGERGISTQLGSASKEELPGAWVERLTKKSFHNAFQLMMLPEDATDQEIKQQFRKISVLVHPDKCQLEGAQDAFHALNKANEELQKPEYREKFKAVIAEARRMLERNREKENKKRAKMGLPPLEEDPRDIMEQCNKLVQEGEERREYARKTREANERREKEAEEELLKEEEDERKKKRVREETMDTRVGDWRSHIQVKKTKVDHTIKPTYNYKEQRDADDEMAKSLRKPMGIDESYKKTWR